MFSEIFDDLVDIGKGLKKVLTGDGDIETIEEIIDDGGDIMEEIFGDDN